MTPQLRADFVSWYQAYPRKIAPRKAEQAYYAARKRGASAEDLLSGTARYIQGKPAWQQFAHPATFLNGDYYLNDYGEPQVIPLPDVDWYAECLTLHGGACGGRYLHSIQKGIDDMKARKDAV